MSHTPELDTQKSKASWTPEPWKVDSVNYPTDIYASPNKKHIGPTLIAETKSVDYPYKMAKANAARIVAAVNAVAGITTEDLQKIGLGGLATLYADKHRNTA